MDVDVDAVRRNLDEEVDLGAALLDRRDAVRLDDRVRDRPVLDDPAVDEDVLLAADRALVAKRRDESVHRQAARFLVDLDEVGALAEQLKEPLGHSGRRRTLEELAAAARQREADLRIAERHLRHQPRDLRRLRLIRLEELAPRRQVEEEVGDLDARAFRRADLAHRYDRPGVDADLGAASSLPRSARPQQEARHRRDAGQRLAAEPQRANRREVVLARDLARRMPLDRQPRILRLHAVAVVFDANQLLAAELDVRC